MALDQIRNWGWTQIVHADDIGENIRLWKHAIDTGEPFQVVHRLKRADGSYRWHLSRAHAMRDASGKVSMWIGSNTNIHDQKEREDQLPETQKLAVGAYPFRAKPAAPRSTGETLRSERLRRGWTLKQVTAETKISTHLLEALEEDRFDRLPYGLLTRNFVRQYAHVLGLDEAAALASLKQQLDALAPPPPEPRRKSIIKIPHLPPLRFRLKLEQELAFGLRLAAAGGLRLCQGRRWCAGLRTHVAVLRRLLGRAAAPLIMSGLKKER
jgi:transcriptional regulator with XRE-family HTH domain